MKRNGMPSLRLLALMLPWSMTLSVASLSALTTPEDEIRLKVEKVFSRMDQEDKIAEITGIRPKEILDESGNLSLEKCRKVIPHGIGQFCQFTTALKKSPGEMRDLVLSIQHYLVSETHAKIPAIFHEEMITGFPNPGSTTYPQHLGVGCSWNPGLVGRCASLTAESARRIGSTLALSPMVDLIRTSYWERMEEGFGEDAYLTSRLGLSFVKGLQGSDLATGVAATTKHFVGYGGDTRDESELYDEYLMPHEAAIALGKVSCVMPCYAKFREIPSIGSRELLTEILRGHLGFRGLVLSDYGAVNQQRRGSKHAKDPLEAAVKAINAGNDVELAHPVCYPWLPEAVRLGLVSQETIDVAVKRSLTLKARLGLLDEHPVFAQEGALDLDPPAHRQAAYDAAAQSLVLLKNNGILPLAKKASKIALVGPNADTIYCLCGDYSYQSLASFWWGIKPDADNPRLVTLLQGLRNRLPAGVSLGVERGCDWSDPLEGKDATSEGGDDRLNKVAKMIERLKGIMHEGLPPSDPGKALELAAGSDVIIAAMGENFALCGEGRRRADIRLPGEQEKFLRQLIATGKPVILVLFSGRPLALGNLPEGCAAIVGAWYPGEEGGNAVADLLLGTINPSGKLCVSWPKEDSKEMLSYENGYTDKLRPLYPFGFGLSYTTYAYSDLKVPAAASTSDTSIPVSLKVRNTGSRAGTEIVQLYVAPGEGIAGMKPLRLRGFRRVELKAGEEREVSFRLSPEQLAVWKNGCWNIQPGSYRILAGASSTDLPLRAEILLKGTEKRFARRSVFFSDQD
jgi:beta-glucosidase